MVFKPSLNITEQIADHLANMVIQGQLCGGARIQELKIANQLGVSRGSVREALLILERRQLIEIVPRKGAVVSDFPVCEALELLDMLLPLERRWLHALASGDRSYDCLQEARAALTDMDGGAKAGQPEAVLRARGDFYATLLRPASRYINGTFACLLPSSQRLMRVLLEGAGIDLHDIARYYRAMHTALEACDNERLEELLGAFHKRIRSLVQKSFSAQAKPANLNWGRPSLSAYSGGIH